MVARMRRLATQSRQLDGLTAVDFDHEYVSTIYIRLLVIPPSNSPNVCGTIGMVKSQDPQTTGLTFLVQGNVYGQLAAILSLSTNVLATSLIAYKAWCVLAMLPPVQCSFSIARKLNREHRQMMKRHFAEDMTTSRVFKALALLMESGFIYCALLVIVAFIRGPLYMSSLLMAKHRYLLSSTRLIRHPLKVAPERRTRRLPLTSHMGVSCPSW